MADSDKPQGVPTSCTRCGGPLQRRRRPISLKEFMAITILLGFGGLSGGRYYEHWREAGLPDGGLVLFVFVPHGLAALVLIGGLVDSPRHTNVLRCARCFTPHEDPKVRGWALSFWEICLAVFLIFLFFYVWS